MQCIWKVLIPTLRNLRYRPIDECECTFSDCDICDVYIFKAEAFKRVLDETLGSVPTILERKSLMALDARGQEGAPSRC